MRDTMEFWVVRPLKSVLCYFKDTCCGRKKSHNTKAGGKTYVSSATGTSTQNIIKLLTLSGTVVTASAIELPQLFFKDHLSQAYFLAFNQSASGSEIDTIALNKTLNIINNQILSQCNVSMTTLFRYTPDINVLLSCSTNAGIFSVRIVFNLISDKAIPAILLDCINKKIFSNFDMCLEDPKTLPIILGIVLGPIGLIAIVTVAIFCSKKRIGKVKSKARECYSKFLECIRPNVIHIVDELKDSIINEADESTALVPSSR